MIVLMTPENKKVQVNTDTDDCLFEAARNPPDTGTNYTSGTDYYAHKARSGRVYFYSYSWSIMKTILLEKAGLTGWDGLDNKTKAKKYFPGIFNEDA